METYERLKMLREQERLSQADLAKLMGKSQSAVAKYETGRSQADYSTLAWYSKYFDVSVDWILGIVDDPQKIKISHPTESGIQTRNDKDISDEYRELLDSEAFAEQVRKVLGKEFYDISADNDSNN